MGNCNQEEYSRPQAPPARAFPPESRTKQPRGQCLKTSIDFSFAEEYFLHFLCLYEMLISTKTGCRVKEMFLP